MGSPIRAWAGKKLHWRTPKLTIAEDSSWPASGIERMTVMHGGLKSEVQHLIA